MNDNRINKKMSEKRNDDNKNDDNAQGGCVGQKGAEVKTMRNE